MQIKSFYLAFAGSAALLCNVANANNYDSDYVQYANIRIHNTSNYNISCKYGSNRLINPLIINKIIAANDSALFHVPNGEPNGSGIACIADDNRDPEPDSITSLIISKYNNRPNPMTMNCSGESKVEGDTGQLYVTTTVDDGDEERLTILLQNRQCKFYANGSYSYNIEANWE